MILVKVVISDKKENDECEDDFPATDLYEALQQRNEWHDQRRERISGQKDNSSSRQGKRPPGNPRDCQNIDCGGRLVSKGIRVIGRRNEKHSKRGFLTQFKMNEKALSIVGNVSICWKHDTSYGGLKLLSDPVLLYNDQEVTNTKM